MVGCLSAAATMGRQGFHWRILSRDGRAAEFWHVGHVDDLMLLEGASEKFSLRRTVQGCLNWM